MKVYSSVNDPGNVSGSFPGERDEFSSIDAAKSWFFDFINASTNYGTAHAAMDLYASQDDDSIVRRLIVGRYVSGYHRVRVER